MTECGLTNLISCLPKKILEAILSIFNAPIQPLLDFIKRMLTEPADISLFVNLRTIMIYIISISYGLLFMWAGFNFMISGYNIEKRIKAKEWFKNILLMVILIQASYFFYELVIDINALLSTGVYNMIDPNFFLFDVETGLASGFFVIPYALTLLVTALILVIRFLIISIGVVLVPIGIFFYFISPLRSYGSLIFDFLLTTIFSGFLSTIVLLCCSILVQAMGSGLFKILVMMTAFSLVTLLLVVLVIFSLLKSAFSTILKVKFLTMPFK